MAQRKAELLGAMRNNELLITKFILFSWQCFGIFCV